MPPGPVAFGLLSLPRDVADCVSAAWVALVPSLDPETDGVVAEPLGAGVCADAGRMQTNRPATANMGRYEFIFFAQIRLILVINPNRAR
jgi:hypothetical protein